MEKHYQKKRRDSKSNSKFCLIVKNVAANGREEERRRMKWKSADRWSLISFSHSLVLKVETDSFLMSGFSLP